MCVFHTLWCIYTFFFFSTSEKKFYTNTKNLTQNETQICRQKRIFCCYTFLFFCYFFWRELHAIPTDFLTTTYRNGSAPPRYTYYKGSDVSSNLLRRTAKTFHLLIFDGTYMRCPRITEPRIQGCASLGHTLPGFRRLLLPPRRADLHVLYAQCQWNLIKKFHKHTK